MHSAVHRVKNTAEEGLVFLLLAKDRSQLRDAELGLAPLEHLRHPLGARVVRADVNDHLHQASEQTRSE